MNNIRVQAATELIKIITFLPEEYQNRIPKEEIQYLNSLKDEKYITKINKIEDITAENMLDETRKYLAYIFINYLSTGEEREEYESILKENETKYQKKLEEKYDIQKIFEKRKNDNTEKALIIVKEKTLFEIILEKIKSLFKKKR